MVDNTWLLVFGMVFIGLGSFITLTKHRPQLATKRLTHWLRPSGLGFCFWALLMM